ncbi:MAG: aminoacyl-tRNA hydrolase [Bacteroidaceae bacterium]|nr:aminoacyl-tRNA hydrolase [Bacteroidaceae bacterium]
MNNLIVGLGNIGAEYADTRHNIGFRVLDALAGASNAVFSDRRYGFVTEVKVKNQTLILLKPSTYMNLSGNAVRYWMRERKIDPARLLIVVDDLALPLGALRLKANGSEGGHNGLRSITQQLATQQYARLRFGIGGDFARGQQIDYVLGPFSADEELVLEERIPLAVEAVKSFALQGIDRTMNQFNNK